MFPVRRFAYFARASDTELVKIGVSVDPPTRLQRLQTGCPYTLELIGTLPGGRPVEAHLHEMLTHRLERGEWYRLDLEEIEALLDVDPAHGLAHIKEHIERTALELG
jgi:hypothetical protein